MANSSNISRRERERLRHRQEIINAAMDLFSEKGYAHVSVQEIAERAEFATGTVYNFFDNKKDLYKAMIVQYIEQAHSLLTEALTGDISEIEKIRRFIRVKGDIFEEHANFIRIYVAETRGLGFTLEKGLFKEKLRSIITTLENVFISGIERGLFREFNPRFLAVALSGLTSVFLVHAVEEPGDFNYSKLDDTIFELFFNNVLIDKDKGSQS